MYWWNVPLIRAVHKTCKGLSMFLNTSLFHHFNLRHYCFTTTLCFTKQSITIADSNSESGFCQVAVSWNSSITTVLCCFICFSNNVSIWQQARKVVLCVWGGEISTLALENVYKYIQFVGFACEENRYEGKIQEYVCEELNLPEEYTCSFWNAHGMDIVLKFIWRKMQTIKIPQWR